MTKLSFSFDALAEENIRKAKISEEYAAKALLQIAVYLRQQEAIPGNLAEYLAGAIEASMLKPKDKGKALSEELGLSAKNRRPRDCWFEIGKAVEELLDAGKTKFFAFPEVAEDYGLSKETVANYYKVYSEAMIETEKMYREEKAR